MGRVVNVILIRCAPLIQGYPAARLNNPEHLLINTYQVGGVAGGFDGVGSVIRVVRDIHLHKVALDKRAKLGDSSRSGILGGTLKLIGIIIESGNMGPSELDNLSSRTT